MSKDRIIPKYFIECLSQSRWYLERRYWGEPEFFSYLIFILSMTHIHPKQIASNAGRDSVGFERLTSTSSANRDSFCSPAAVLIPVILLFSLIHCASGSIKIANRIGLRGQPCLVDLSRKNLSVSSPYIFCLADGLS